MNSPSSPWFNSPGSANDQWDHFEQLVVIDHADFFDDVSPIAGARAPGRLDVMGGVADYSGSMVLEMPLAEAACVAWQWRTDRKLRVRSLLKGASAGEFLSAVFSLDDLLTSDGYLRTPSEVHQRLTGNVETRWAAYIVGCYYVMLSAYTQFSQGKVDSRVGELGANILLSSSVPLGAGVSSSAAIEVATMHALNEAAGIHPSDMTLAAWCQRVENTIVGAPCGIMDQVTSALGLEDNLLVLQCQPHNLIGYQRTPPGWKFVGIDSRVKHSVGGSAYTEARVGAFMGLKIIQLESGGKPKQNYLCQLSHEEFSAYSDLVPEVVTGEEFGRLYGILPDTVTSVDLETTYYPRACAEHPILENERVKHLFGMMQIASARHIENSAPLDSGGLASRPDVEILLRAGKLMYAAHESYSQRLKLGSPETDLIVKLVANRGSAMGLYGAKITGGGAGGTVAILCDATCGDYELALQQVCSEYHRQTGVSPTTFCGSSPGAVSFGARHIIRG